MRKVDKPFDQLGIYDVLHLPYWPKSGHWIALDVPSYFYIHSHHSAGPAVLVVNVNDDDIGDWLPAGVYDGQVCEVSKAFIRWWLSQSRRREWDFTSTWVGWEGRTEDSSTVEQLALAVLRGDETSPFALLDFLEENGRLEPLVSAQLENYKKVIDAAILVQTALTNIPWQQQDWLVVRHKSVRQAFLDLENSLTRIGRIPDKGILNYLRPGYDSPSGGVPLSWSGSGAYTFAEGQSHVE